MSPAHFVHSGAAAAASPIAAAASTTEAASPVFFVFVSPVVFICCFDSVAGMVDFKRRAVVPERE